MPIQTTSNPSANAYRTKYEMDFLMAVRGKRRVYDVYAVNIGDERLNFEKTGTWLASTFQTNFAGDMTPATAAISETTDIIPQVIRDATGTLTTTSRGDALQWAEAVDIRSYLPYGKA